MGSLSVDENWSETEKENETASENCCETEKVSDTVWSETEKGNGDTVGGENVWSGIVEKTISAPLSKVWDIASNFWEFPNLLTIEPVEGENGVAGCVRKVLNLPGRTDTDECQWATQKLVDIDPEQYVFSYEFVETNTGVKPGYYSTFQAKQEGEGEEEEEGGSKTLVRWAFRFGPTQEGGEHLVPFIMSGTDMYIQQLEKLANSESGEEEEAVTA